MYKQMFAGKELKIMTKININMLTLSLLWGGKW